MGDGQDKMGKIIFLNQLRGLAALFVVCAHYLENFWFRQKSIGTILHQKPLENLDPPLLSELFTMIPIISFGEFGVALFFLISGFVIPLSLEKYGTFPFLLSRFFRVWPTYMVGFLVTVFALFMVSRLSGNPFPYTLSQMAVQSVIVLRDWLWFPNIDGIVWTLEIEIKFYLFMALWFSLFRTLSYHKITVFMLGLSVFLLLLPLIKGFLFYQAKPLFYALNVISFNTAIIAYMLCGTIFYMIFSGRLSVKNSRPYLMVLLACFFCVWFFGLYTSGKYAILQYFLAFAVFAICFYFKDAFKPSKLLDYLARVSYPLYVIHGVAGYGLMRILVTHGFPEAVALLLGFLSAFVLATALHYLIEKPTHHIGKSLGKRYHQNNKGS